MKFILLDTERRGGLKIRHHGHIGFSVVLIFDSRKGELVRGLVLIFKNRIRSIEWCERFAVWLFSEFHFFLACSGRDRKSTRLNSSHSQISYAVFCLKKKKIMTT